MQDWLYSRDESHNAEQNLQVLREYRISNAQVSIRCNATMDDIIDTLEADWGFCWVLLGLVELEVSLNAQVEIPMGMCFFSQGQSKVLPSDLCDEQDRSDHHWRTWHYCGGFVNLHGFLVESTCCNKILKKQLCLCHWGATSCTYLCASWVESRWFGRDGLEIHEPFEDNTSPILETSLMKHGYMLVTLLVTPFRKTRMKLASSKRQDIYQAKRSNPRLHRELWHGSSCDAYITSRLQQLKISLSQAPVILPAEKNKIEDLVVGPEGYLKAW